MRPRSYLARLLSDVATATTLLRSSRMTPWKVEATAEDFERLRTDERFAALLSLGRTANLQRSALGLGMPDDKATVTVVNRSMMSATLLMSGLIAEALGSLEQYARHWRSLPAYTELVVH